MLPFSTLPIHAYTPIIERKKEKKKISPTVQQVLNKLYKQQLYPKRILTAYNVTQFSHGFNDIPISDTKTQWKHNLGRNLSMI